MKLFHNGLSTCSQKVRLALAEKQLTFASEILNLQKGDQFTPEYQRLNPKQLVPVLEDGGRYYVESTLINEYVDDAYPDSPLKPDAPHDRYRMRAFIKMIDEVQHPACAVITYAIGFRPQMLKKDPQEVQALIDKVPDPLRRENRRAVIKDGVGAPVFKEALGNYMKVFEEAELILQDSDWLAGEFFSLADCALTPYVLRLEHLGQSGLFSALPRLQAWFDRVRQRPCYDTAISDWLVETAVSHFLEGGKQVEREVAALY